MRISNTRRLSEANNFFQNQGLLKKLPRAYSGYRSLASSLTSEDNFFCITQSLGKRAFSESLLENISTYPKERKETNGSHKRLGKLLQVSGK